MQASDTLDRSEFYAPREAGFVALVDRPDCTIKLSAICAGPLCELDRAVVDAAVATVESAETAGHPAFSEARQLGAGFAVLHFGEEGVWLLLHRWMPGGIASRHLWRAAIDRPTLFEKAPDHLMACVWELAVIDFERKAWMDTALAGKPLADYFARRLPRGTV